MHAILGMSNILSRKERLEHQEQYLNAIKQSSENLLVLLNDILDMSKIEAGKQVFGAHPQRVCPAQFPPVDPPAEHARTASWVFLKQVLSFFFRGFFFTRGLLKNFAFTYKITF